MIRFRMLMIAAAYEDANGAATLRQDAVLKMAQGTLPSGRVPGLPTDALTAGEPA